MLLAQRAYVGHRWQKYFSFRSQYNGENDALLVETVNSIAQDVRHCV